MGDTDNTRVGEADDDAVSEGDEEDALDPVAVGDAVGVFVTAPAHAAGTRDDACSGPDDCPNTSDPQHTAVPLPSTAQLCARPAAITPACSVAMTTGTAHCPAVLDPKHTTVPSVMSASVW